MVLQRTVARFEAESAAAAAQLRTLPKPPAFIAMPRGDQRPAHVWLNTVVALTDQSREIASSGHAAGERMMGGMVTGLVHASKLACARLAANDLPDLTRQRAGKLGDMVTKYHELLNAATNAKFDDESRKRLDDHANLIADALSAWGGPVMRAVFLSAPPHGQVYSGLPLAHAAFWQKHVGQWQHLRTIASAWGQ